MKDKIDKINALNDKQRLKLLVGKNSDGKVVDMIKFILNGKLFTP